MLFLFDNDINAIVDWDHTHIVFYQDYDLNYTIGWNDDFDHMTRLAHREHMPW
eukprot:SAG11_NODE_15986_length_560_cov_1.329718_2_plen_53_part_00